MKIQDLFIPTKRNKYRAYLLKVETISIVTLIVFIFNIFISSLPLSEAQAQIDMNSIVYFHNRERAKADLIPLALDSKLIASATKKAKLMLQYNCWDHFCPPGMSPWDLFKEEEYKYLYAGENLAEGFVDNSVMMKAWMNSPTHRENVLKGEFSEIGVGYVVGDFQGKKDNIIVAVHFGHPYEEINISDYDDKDLSSDIDLIKHIRIINPKRNDLISDPYVIVEGETDPGIQEVELNLGKSVLDVLDITSNGFNFNSDKLYQFPEGQNLIYVIGKDELGNIVADSDKLDFTIDTTAPFLDLKKIIVKDIKQLDSFITQIEVTTDDDISKSELTIGGKTYFGHRMEGGKIEFQVDLEEIKSNNLLQVYLEDYAGNSSTAEVSSEYLKNQAESIMQKTNQEGNNNSLSIMDRLLIVPSEVQFDIKIFNTKNTFNLIIIFSLSGLLMIDYMIIKRLNINIHRHGHQHLKVGILIAVGIISLLSGGIGHILTGINI